MAVNQTSSNRDSQSSLSLSPVGPQSSCFCHRLFKLNWLSYMLFLSFVPELVLFKENVCFLHMLTSGEFRHHPSFMCSESTYTVDTSLFLSVLVLCVYRMSMLLLIIPCGGWIKENEAVMWAQTSREKQLRNIQSQTSQRSLLFVWNWRINGFERQQRRYTGSEIKP